MTWTQIAITIAVALAFVTFIAWPPQPQEETYLLNDIAFVTAWNAVLRGGDAEEIELFERHYKIGWRYGDDRYKAWVRGDLK